MEKDLPTIQHEDYAETEPFRDTFKHVCDGTAALRKHAAMYLPQFPLESDDDYKVRCSTATLLNVTQKTRDTLCGLVFQKPLTLGDDVPEAIVSLAENIDNKGNHINVFARDVFEDSFDGWSVILTDCPTAKVNDLGEQKALGIRPYAVAYDACDVINWDYNINPISKKRELSLIVLREYKRAVKGMFTRENVTRYRVFYMANSQVYWQLWEEQKNDKGEKVVVQIEDDTLIPKLDAIPVAVVGELGDPPPLMDLMFTNIKYAQKESDYDSIIHKTCVPLPYVTGVTADEIGQAQAGGVMYCLPEGSTLGFAEVAGSSIEQARKNLEDLKADMAWLGLEMLMPKPKGGGKATATEVVADSIKDTSALQVRAEQLKDALELTLSFMAQYLGLGKESGGSVELGCSWQQMTITTQELQMLSQCVSDGTLSLESFLWSLEKAGKLPPDVTAEDEAKRIEEYEKAQTAVKPVLNALAMPNGVTNDKTQKTQEGNVETVPNTGAVPSGVGANA